jgi:hypothetical protein
MHIIPNYTFNNFVCLNIVAASDGAASRDQEALAAFYSPQEITHLDFRLSSFEYI